MKKLYYILREDFFKVDNGLVDPIILYVGSLWLLMSFSPEHASSYKYSKTEVE
jgi:hypothetical protein